MAVDRGAAGDERQRRALQGLASSTGFVVGPGLGFSESDQELFVELSAAPQYPGLKLYPSGLGVLVSPISALKTRADGLYLDLAANSGLTISATALKVLLAAGSLLTLTGGLAVSSRVPRWVKTTLSHTAFQVASTTAQANLYSLPAGWSVLACKIKHSAAFAGGVISAYTVSVGTAGTPAKYGTAFNVFQAPGATVQQIEHNIGVESHAAATQLIAQAVSTGANTNASTAGSVDIWLLVGDSGA